MKTSKLFTLKLRDFLYAALLTTITSIGVSIMNVIDMGKVPNIHELLLALKVGLIAGLGYLIKNILSNSKGQLLAKENNGDISTNGFNPINGVQSTEKNK